MVHYKTGTKCPHLLKFVWAYDGPGKVSKASCYPIGHCKKLNKLNNTITTQLWKVQYFQMRQFQLVPAIKIATIMLALI